MESSLSNKPPLDGYEITALDPSVSRYELSLDVLMMMPVME
jgi:hypothetical protein